MRCLGLVLAICCIAFCGCGLTCVLKDNPDVRCSRSSVVLLYCITPSNALGHTVSDSAAGQPPRPQTAGLRSQAALHDVTRSCYMKVEAGVSTAQQGSAPAAAPASTAASVMVPSSESLSMRMLSFSWWSGCTGLPEVPCFMGARCCRSAGTACLVAPVRVQDDKAISLFQVKQLLEVLAGSAVDQDHVFEFLRWHKVE